MMARLGILCWAPWAACVTQSTSSTADPLWDAYDVGNDVCVIATSAITDFSVATWVGLSAEELVGNLGQAGAITFTAGPDEYWDWDPAVLPASGTLVLIPGAIMAAIQYEYGEEFQELQHCVPGPLVRVKFEVSVESPTLGPAGGTVDVWSRGGEPNLQWVMGRLTLTDPPEWATLAVTPGNETLLMLLGTGAAIASPSNAWSNPFMSVHSDVDATSVLLWGTNDALYP
jgi:hypothetical protein